MFSYILAEYPYGSYLLFVLCQKFYKNPSNPGNIVFLQTGELNKNTGDTTE